MWNTQDARHSDWMLHPKYTNWRLWHWSHSLQHILASSHHTHEWYYLKLIYRKLPKNCWISIAKNGLTVPWLAVTKYFPSFVNDPQNIFFSYENKFLLSLGKKLLLILHLCCCVNAPSFWPIPLCRSFSIRTSDHLFIEFESFVPLSIPELCLILW